MSDTVAIVAVASSGAIGLAGVLTNVYGAAAWRRWQSREERVAELRNVLDTAAESLSRSMQLIGRAQALMSSGGQVTEETVTAVREALTTAEETQNQLWAATSRVSLRMGPNAAFYDAAAGELREAAAGKRTAAAPSGGHGTVSASRRTTSPLAGWRGYSASPSARSPGLCGHAYAEHVHGS